MDLITDYCEKNRTRVTTLVAKRASELHDLLNNYHMANGKGVHILVHDILQIKAKKAIWEEHVLTFSACWTAQFLLKWREVSIFHNS